MQIYVHISIVTVDQDGASNWLTHHEPKVVPFDDTISNSTQNNAIQSIGNIYNSER